MAYLPLAPYRSSTSTCTFQVSRFPLLRFASQLRPVFLWPCPRPKLRRANCTHVVQSSFDSAFNTSKQDEDYVQAHVLEAVSMVPAHGQLFMTLANGKEVEVHHVNPAQGRLLYKSSTPAIFLKIEHEQDLMLPIIVGEVAVTMLLRALHDEEHLGRPNYYHLLRDTVDALNHEVRKVRVTERVDDTYYARIDVGKPGDLAISSVDARPSDAINIALRCKVPIFVNKSIVAADAVRPVIGSSCRVLGLRSWGKDSSLDSADSGPDPVAEEITLMRSMLLAVVEERYADAARWRDELRRFRMALSFEGRTWQL